MMNHYVVAARGLDCEVSASNATTAIRRALKVIDGRRVKEGGRRSEAILKDGLELFVTVRLGRILKDRTGGEIKFEEES